ncbi:two-component system sensor histidine kinase BaeS [Pseudoduganella flava]|uniref:histidine kinase n=1 Tax=Pseudoduganella flava TaxID=871742 RepID=A0A562PIP5_9BURK|nr:ATP-binding protein [Pseudoduganella flava]QGZ41913.1 HAMP domain-containing protein [Pseudoduganella flava]TWI44321.1 two-component system sensor histidine kinase BaeS [Pseudoduganella flava]
MLILGIRIGITTRLFCALLVVSVLTALGVGLGTRWSFQRGFQGYLNEVEARRMEAMAFELARAYREHGNWDFIRGNQGAWERYTGAIGRERATAPLAGDTSIHHEGGDSIYYAVPGRGPRRLALYDMDGAHLAGNHQTEGDMPLRYQRVLVDGRQVATLVGAPLRGLSEEAEQGFLVQQQRDSALIGLATLALAALAAMLLARSFVAPTRRLTVAAAKVAAGDYGVRVPDGGRDELATLARNFNSMTATLESNEALRRHFMADISHELRTPLAVLQAQLEAMEDGIEPMNQRSVTLLTEEVATLSRLIEDMRQITLTDAGVFDYHIAPLDLAQLVGAELAKWRDPLAVARTAVYAELPEHLTTRGDTIRLRQLLRNLFTNLLRHAEGATRVALLLKREDGHAVLTFADDGRGVPHEALTMLFERFWRGDSSRSRGTGGSGLGLAICRSIAEAHGGTIAAGATLGGGLTITLRLPLEEPA